MSAWRDAEARSSIDAWTAERPNVQPALELDASAPTWPVERIDAIVNINMIHISPWSACLGLLAGAARLLSGDQPLCLYGPYLRDGVETAPSNVAFDESLRARNPAWGIRALEKVVDAASAAGLRHHETVEMPANNLCVLFRRA